MCNLYSFVTRMREREFERRGVERDRAHNMGDIPEIYPDQDAPVIRAGSAIEALPMRWGMPGPPQFGGRPVTNIRNLASPHWRRWLDPAQRCLVPATAFCEWTDERPKVKHWFALGPDEPVFYFAGIWQPWTGVRKKIAGDYLLYAFLTTEPNDIVRPVHAKAMPVMLTTDAECETWLRAPIAEARTLQRPLPAELLHIVGTGDRPAVPVSSPQAQLLL
jgi:putative SOS response-associated peptidase YedK